MTHCFGGWDEGELAGCGICPSGYAPCSREDDCHCFHTKEQRCDERMDCPHGEDEVSCGEYYDHLINKILSLLLYLSNFKFFQLPDVRIKSHALVFKAVIHHLKGVMVLLNVQTNQMKQVVLANVS